MTSQAFDFIVVGGGSNGLTAAAYLAKAGERVLVIERRSLIGGGCVTEELTLPGFKHNPHSCMHIWLQLGPVYVDLEMEKYGSKYVFPEIQYGAVFPDGRCLVLYRDLDRTVQEIARFSERDARTYHEFCMNYRGLVDGVRTFLYSEPVEPWLGWSAMMDSRDGAELVRTSLTSVRNLVYDLFEAPEVRAWMLLFINQAGTDADAGTGRVVPPLWPIIHNTHGVGAAIGGSSTASEALGNVIEAHGGTVLRGCHVSRILLDDGRATGVELEDGQRFLSRKAVISNVEPKQTFFKMIGEEHLDAFFARQVRRFRADEFTTFCVHLAIDQAPRWRASDFNPDIDKAWTVGVMPSQEAGQDYLQLWADIRVGKASKCFLAFVLTPSLIDPTQAPPGKHTMLLWQPAVFDLAEGAEAWDDIKEAYADEIYDYIGDYAHNLTQENVLKMNVDSPLDLERRNISMWKGSMLGGAPSQDQLTIFRPYYGYRPYRTPFEGLYLCGPSTHPEGGLSGACGYNAATAVADDFNINQWWKSN